MRQLWIFLSLTVLALSACSDDAEQHRVSTGVEMWSDELPIRDPWLRERLPEDALMYLRAPNPLGLFASPKGNVMDAALRSRANVENLQKIRAGLADNVIASLPSLDTPQLALLARHTRSPIEIAGRFLPAPSGIAAVNLDIDSNSAFETLVNELGIMFANPLDAAGTTELIGLGFPAFANFQEDTGQLLLQAGPGANAQTFADIVAATQRDTPHPMQRLERRIDASGQGFFFWMNAQEALPAMQLFVPLEQYRMMSDAGLEKVDAVAYGWGAANGKSRLSVVADISRDRELLPIIDNALSARSVGAPDALIMMSLPNADYFERLAASPLLDDDEELDWQTMNDNFNDVLGITLEDLLAAIGPEIMLIFDRAGDYGAIRLRNADAWDDAIRRMSAATGSSPDSFERGGQTYYHWSTPSELGMIGQETAAELGWFGELLSRSRDHYYWVREGDYLYVAGSPQVLFDRALLDADTDIGSWLRDGQRIDGSTALLSFSGTSRKLPTRLYGAYIEISQMLADFALADIDVWAMPSAAELGLPERGTYGLTLDLGNPTVALELTFENNPVEMVGSLGGVAAIGILAAVAVPAYQDYTIRAQVAAGLNLSSDAKTGVTEIYLTAGRFPNDSEAEDLSLLAAPNDAVSAVAVEPGTGAIRVDYTGSVASGGQLFLEPSVSGGNLIWDCYGTFDDKHLPAACRR